MSFLNRLFQPRLESAFLANQRDLVQRKKLDAVTCFQQLSQRADVLFKTSSVSSQAYAVQEKCSFGLIEEPVVILFTRDVSNMTGPIENPSLTLTDYATGESLLICSRRHGLGSKVISADAAVFVTDALKKHYDSGRQDYQRLLVS